MKKVLYICLGLVVLCGGVYVFLSQKTQVSDISLPEQQSVEQPVDNGRVRAPEDIVLGVGKKGVAAGMTITFNKLVSDSRCPAGVQCVWAGAVTANVTLESGIEKTIVDIASNKEPIVFAGYLVSIVSVVPDKVQGGIVDLEKYVVMFRIAPEIGAGNSIPANI
ncbi:hypothetical protein IPJ70_01425 [Candidatus Campbellbacteria bacterium]|nr:MAG: hypothetical protein IPJ70_01425 [Candidatus Campbellbacteria bacterium]